MLRAIITAGVGRRMEMLLLIEMRVGSVLFFCFNTPHATGSNLTETGRAGLAYRFLQLSLA